MVHIKAFEALRPPAAVAPKVASPPYDVVSTEEARELAAENPLSFLHVIRPEIDLPRGTDPFDESVYRAAQEGLESLIEQGGLQRDAAPSIYLYRQAWKGHSQIGIVCCCHVEDYQNDVIRKHEKTRQDKEDDRTRHILALDANTGPIFLAFREDDAINARLVDDSAHRPLYHFVTPDGVTHTAWRVTDPNAYIELFANVPHVYVADGHHRTASAARAAAARAAKNPAHNGTEEYNWFLSVLFPAHQLTILPYNRIVTNLNGLSESEFIDSLRSVGDLVQTDEPQPDRPCTFGIRVGEQWWSLTVDEDSIDWSDPIASLDVSLLHDRILHTILGIEDPQTDPRIGFVGGIRGVEELEQHVASGTAAVAFALYPTSIDQLLSVADAGDRMPPKSTWFEPKLRSGLFVHMLDSAPVPNPLEAS
ncbi:MAG TPA: DUF1015 domain-containing protein [Phycisphaerales bacterium]|nr:DUF1015 domain-containing protein [Phycisphaerales bacterium]